MGFGNKFKEQVDNKLVTVKSTMKKGKTAAGKGFKKAAGFSKAKKKSDQNKVPQTGQLEGVGDMQN